MITALRGFVSPIPLFVKNFGLSHKIVNAEKIYQFVLPYFKTGTAFFFLGFGAKEICFDAKKVDGGYALDHGTLYIGAAICSIFESLHHFYVINFDKYYSLISWSGTSLFLLANLIALDENVSLYYEGKEQGDFTKIKSAILGIISNFGYLTSGAFAILGGSATITFLIAGVSACFGGLKILHDFYYEFLAERKEGIIQV